MRLFLLALLVSQSAMAATHVRGYTTSSGTYVAPHYRSNADTTTSNNYGTSGNVNPYNGNIGHKDNNDSGAYKPYKSPYDND